MISNHVEANVLDYDIVVSEFEFQSSNCVHFRAPLYPQLWVKQYHYCSSTRMALALINPRKMTKKSNPNPSLDIWPCLDK